MKRDSFVFYRSFYEAIQDIPKKHQVAIYSAIFSYAFDGKEPTLCGVSNAIWKAIRPQLDASAKRYDNAKKGAEYGKLGGRPKKKDENKKPLKGYENETPNVNVNVNVNDNDNSNVNVNANSNPSGSDDSAGQSGTNTTPSFKEVADEVAEKGFKISAVKFYEYYEKNGWKTNEGEPIRDWKKMLAVWNMKERFGVDAASGKAKPKKNAFNSFEQREYSNGDLEAMLLQRGDN